MAYRLTRRAHRDAVAIWGHIAEDSESAADQFVDLLVHHFQMLGDNPHAGPHPSHQTHGDTKAAKVCSKWIFAVLAVLAFLAFLARESYRRAGAGNKAADSAAAAVTIHNLIAPAAASW